MPVTVVAATSIGYPAWANPVLYWRSAREQFMKALILYVLFVTIGAMVSIGIGYFVEIEFSSTASLIVFLALFFANFAVSWLAVILVMDGTLKDAQGRQAQLDIEKSGRTGIALREANAITARAARTAAAAAAVPKARPAS